MEAILPIVACLTCFAVGHIITRVIMDREYSGMIDGMRSTIGAYQRIHGPQSCHPQSSPANHAYYEDDSEVGSRVWMDHVSDPLVMGAAEALGLLEEQEVIELTNGAGDIVYQFTHPIRNPYTSAASAPITVRNP